MLEILTGTDKHAKMEYLLRLAERAAQKTTAFDAAPVLWLTPDQFAFETERALLYALSAAARRKMTVTGFNRYSHTVMKTLGGVAGRYADNLCKLILMRRALSDCKDKLTLYARQAEKNDLAFSKELIAFMRQTKYAGITPQALLETSAQDTLSPDLRAKTKDLSTLALHYEARLSASWRDSLDDLSAANARIAEAGARGAQFFAGKTVLIDGFKSFTYPEYEMIKLMLRQGASVVVSLTLNRRQAQSDLTSIFAVTLDTYDRLCALAHGHFSERVFAPPVPQTALSYIKENLFLDGCKPFTADHPDVAYGICRDEYREAEYCLGTIKAEIQKKNGALRYKDVAVVCRDTEEYRFALEAAAKKFSVPYCIDGGESPEFEPLFTVCRAFLQGAYLQFDRLCPARIVKSGLFPVTADEIASLDAYINVWRPNSLSEWKTPFTASLSGYEIPSKQKESAAGPIETAAAERVRSAVMAGFFPLLEIREGNGRAFGEALLAALQKTGVLERFTMQIKRAPLAESERLKRVKNNLTDTLVRLSDAIAEEKVSGREYAESFLLAVRESRIKAVEQTMDCVIVGSADTVRLHDPKLLWLLGANEGVFPKTPENGSGLFSDRECIALSKLDLPVSKTAEDQLSEERFSAYQMICAPSEALYVTCRQRLLGGEDQLPGELIWRLERILGESANLLSLDEAALTSTPQAALDTALSMLKKDKTQSDALFAAIDRLPEEYAPLRLTAQRAQQAQNERLFALTEKESAAALYRIYNRMLSPSEIELYFTCPFAYFVKYGLRLRVPERAAFQPLLRGNIAHEVVAAMTPTLSKMAKRDAARFGAGFAEEDGVLQEQITLLCRKTLFEELSRRFENPGRVSERDKSLAAGMVKVLSRIAMNIYDEQRQSKFVVHAVEQQIGGKRYPPLSIRAGAHLLQIGGRIDRLDTYTKENQTFFRIIDYKTGRKDFSFAGVISGQNLQMLLYEMALEETGELLPAGVLYYPARRLENLKDPNADLKERREHILSGFCMDGLVIDAADQNLPLTSAMEKELKRYYIPVGRDKKGRLDQSSLVSPREYKAISGYIRRKLIKMAENISEGDISPLYKAGCAHCDYKPLCGRDIRVENLEEEKLSSSEAFTEIISTEGKEES